MSLPQKQIDSADQTNLAEFLLTRGMRLRKVSTQYVWDERNVWISGSKWYSHYDQIGGHAIDFVMKYFGRSFTEAVQDLSEIGRISDSSQGQEKSQFNPPKRFGNEYEVFMYLRNRRGISPDIINAFIKLRLLYEDAQYHCCVFVGRDDNEKYGHCHKRSTRTSFRQTIAGSKVEYAFHYIGKDTMIYVFEAPIDMLAYISLHPEDWKKHSYVALCSVSERALIHQLETHPMLKTIVLCLDNDESGQKASERIKEKLLEKGYTDVRIEIPKHKDWDEDLQIIKGIKQEVITT